MPFQSDYFHQLYSIWFSLLNRHVKTFLFVPLLLCLLLASGVVNLQENNDGRIFFDEGSIERVQLEALEQKFTESNSLLLVLSSQDGDIFRPDALKEILRITEKAWLLPHVTRVNSLSNFQRITAQKDDLIIKDLFTEDILTNDSAIKNLRDYALREQDLVGQLLSKDGKVTAIAVNIAAPRGDSRAIQTILAGVEKIKQSIKNNKSGLSLHVTGDVPLDNAFSKAYAYDLQNLFPFFLLVVFLLSLYFFRSFILSGLILSMMLMVVAATMGASGFLGIDLTAGTTGVPIILITISLADFIHLLSATRQGIRQDLPEKDAVQDAIKNNFVAISLTSFTTLIGFISLNFSDAPPFRDLGNLVSIGIIVSYVITFTFFPIVLFKLNLGRVFKNNTYGFSVSAPFLLAVSTFFVQKSKVIILSITLISLTISMGLLKIEFDDDWVKYFGQDNIFRKDTEFVVRHLTGVDTIEYMVSSGKEGGITGADFLNKLDEFDVWSRAQPEITHVSSIVSLFKKMNFYMTGGLGQYEDKKATISTNNALNAQYLLMYEMSLPMGLDLNDRIDISKEDTRVTITAQNVTSKQMRDLDTRISQKLREMKFIGAQEGGSGIPLMFAHLSERNIKSMLIGIAFALLVVSLVITVSFKSLTLGVISFVVNILPIILGFGIWGWLYQYVGISLTVVAAIAFGIVVDDSIHFITKYKKALHKKNGNKTEAIQNTFMEIGGALLITSVILIMGFATLSFSLFQPTWGLGLISVIMIFMALIYDFVLLPTLLILSKDS